MFTQVYFHKTRVAFDVHLRGALRELLPDGRFPRPTGQELDQFLAWDDWKVLGLLSGGQGGEHGMRLKTRDHYRRIFHTPEVSSEKDLELLEKVKERLGKLLAATEPASKSWYKTGTPDIPVVNDIDEKTVSPLSEKSNVVANLRANNQVFLYVRPQDVAEGKKIVNEVVDNARPK